MNAGKWLIILAVSFACICIGLVAIDASAATCGSVGQACNDNNPCTVNDTCTSTNVCKGKPITDTTTVCSDNNACTANDHCVSGVCKGTAIVCDDNNICTDDTCVPATGCKFTPNTAVCAFDPANPCIGVCSGGVCTGAAKPASYCDDNAFCTTDTCNINDPNANPVTGCVNTPNTANGVCINTYNNNFTILNKEGDCIPFGGSNDVQFVWDGTMKTSVAVSGQVRNAALASSCPFFGGTWSAHDVAIYGPGKYKVFTGCAPGSPGCGTGAPYVFTVKPGEIGGHMLIDWINNLNIDVVDIWQPSGVFGPNSQMWTALCGTGDAAQVWDWMSYAWYGFKGINPTDACFTMPTNGAPLLEGPFQGSFVNFNLMGHPPCGCASDSACSDNNACTIDTCVNCICVHTPVNCDDGNACTTDSCDPASGKCVHTFTGVTSATLLGDQTAGETAPYNEQIQTTFTAANGCIVKSDADNIYVTPGAVLTINYRAGIGPAPTTVKVDGVSMTTNLSSGSITCAKASASHAIYLDNKKARGGKDVDNLHIFCNAQD